METFSPTWYTILEFADAKPRCMYHKEQDEITYDYQEIKNLHVLARADFVIEKIENYYLQISADDYYKLYINGQYITCGPAPAYPENYYYNQIAISDYLVEGKNVIAVHLYYQGLLNRVWNSSDGRFGIGTSILGENGSKTELIWRYQISEAYHGETIGYETQFLENFDSNKWDGNWAEPDYDEKGFLPMVPAKWADYDFTLQPTKQLETYCKNPLVCKRTKEGMFLDFGEELTGMLYITAKGVKGKEVIIRCGEELEREDTARFELRCNCRYEETWTLAEGKSILEQYDYKAFRYVNLCHDKDVEIEEIYAIVRHYPMDVEQCTFCCNNRVLEDIFHICKNAVKYGTQEGYLDCPTREKGQYLGDAIVTAHAQVWLTGKTDMLRKCIYQFAITNPICKGLMAVAPGAYMQEIADFSLLWSELLLLEYQFTGDVMFLQRYYPVAKEIIMHFKQYERADGLLSKVADKWNLVDWPENLRDDYDFILSRPVVADGCHNVVNALYIGAMKNLSMIEDILNIPKSYDWKKYRDAFYHVFYDKERGLFQDAENSSHCAVHSNIYPLYFEFLPKEESMKIAEFLEGKGLCCGVLLSYFLLKGLAKVGHYEKMYRLLINESEHGWVNMLRESATTCFEVWGKEQKWNTSLCHPWASAPIPLLIEDLAGFKPVQGKAYVFEPHIPDEIETMSLKIPYQGKQYFIEKIAGKEVQCSCLCVPNTLQS